VIVRVFDIECNYKLLINQDIIGASAISMVMIDYLNILTKVSNLSKLILKVCEYSAVLQIVPCNILLRLEDKPNENHML